VIVNQDGGEPSAEDIVAGALRRDVAAHVTGHYEEIGWRYDDVYAEILPLMERQAPTMALAFQFWDGWIDARNHDWQYCEGIGREYWPHLAERVATALEARTEIDDPTLLAHFAVGPRRSLRELVRDRLRRLRP
jgi:hypothetical protein